jgi:hypothetical protein
MRDMGFQPMQRIVRTLPTHDFLNIWSAAIISNAASGEWAWLPSPQVAQHGLEAHVTAKSIAQYQTRP